MGVVTSIYFTDPDKMADYIIEKTGKNISFGTQPSLESLTILLMPFTEGKERPFNKAQDHDSSFP